MAINPLLWAQALAGEAPPGDPITVEAARQKRLALPEPVDQDELNAPPQTGYGYFTEQPAVDPRQVNTSSAAIADPRRALWAAREQDRAAAARAMGQEYTPREQKGSQFKANPKLQFGTTGVLRDIIGNATDFLGMLVGRRPTYRDEKIRDHAFGWDEPGGLEAAVNRVSQYDMGAAMELYKNAQGIKNAQEQARSMAEQRGATADYRRGQILTQGQQQLGMMANGMTTEQGYNRSVKAFNALGQRVFGDSFQPLPETYDPTTTPALMGDITRQGYSQSSAASIERAKLNNESRETIASGKNLSNELIARIRAQTGLTVAQIQAAASEYRANKAAQSRMDVLDFMLQHGIGPAKPTDMQLILGAGAGQGGSTPMAPRNIPQGNPLTPPSNSAPVPGARRGPDGRWYTRGPGGRAVPVQ